jgi:AcrR family transcriptional regulator
MKKQRSDAVKTRLSLLEAAGDVFAEKGFWKTTHEDICSRAKANVAAINYHFGSKENLYIDAWKHSFEKSMEKYPPEGGVLPNAPAEKRLRGRVLSFLKRMADPETHEIDIMLKEIANPTGLLFETISAKTGQFERDFGLLIKELIGKGAKEEQVAFCYMGLMSLCFGPMLHLRSGNEDVQMPRPEFLPFDLGAEKLADYIVSFTLAGIRSFSKISK